MKRLNIENYVELLRQGPSGVEKWNRLRAEARFEGGRIRFENLSGLDLQGVDLSRLHVYGVHFGGSNLSGASLHGGSFGKHGDEEIEECPVDLSQTDLSRADLRNSVFLGTKIVGARLYSANCQGAKFHWLCDLNSAVYPVDLSRSLLTSANLRETVLKDTIMTEATLVDTDLTSAKLDNTDFRCCRCSGSIFGDLDLSSARGLETVTHLGPSVIDVHTLFKSRGKIPEVFLRGCGVPEDFVTFEPPPVRFAIEFHSCFISYSHEDEEFCKHLRFRMQQEKLRVWYAPEDIKAGRKVHEQIDQAIRSYDKLLLVLSENSMGSEWVKTEIYKARQREITEKRRMLFPIRLVSFDRLKSWECFDADTGSDIAREIRKYFIPDFSNWKNHDAFERAFERLLDDLRRDDLG